jgi:uncharacterized protein (TIGR02145 family)
MKEISSPSRIACAALVLVALTHCIALPTSAQSTSSIPVSAGWNLLSLPARVSNGSRPFLFPSAISPAYVFQYPAGYMPQDTLDNGMGFWLKFGFADTVLIQGETVFKDTVEVQMGWNIIGSLSAPIAVTSILTDPPEIIASQFFRYVPGGGYQPDTLLQPGLGYWVKVSQDGSMILASAGGQPCPGVPTVDYAGKIYNTVQIESQCWLKENLDVGTMIPGSQNQTDNSIIEKYCYDNTPANCFTYGGLYQWDEAMQHVTTQGARGICPPGWRIPTFADFDTLYHAVGGDGNALKEVGQGTAAGAGTNASGFSALLAGRRSPDGGFGGLGLEEPFWSCTPYDSASPYALRLFSYMPDIVWDPFSKPHGLSVRCLKDDAPNLPSDTPSNPSPDSTETNVWTSPTLSWSCSDPEGDPLAYDVYFGSVNPPDTLVSSNQSGTSLARNGLTGGTTYYWKVVAKDNHSHSTSGPVWSFTTQ